MKGYWDGFWKVLVCLSLPFLLGGLAFLAGLNKPQPKIKACCSADTCAKEGHHGR